MSPPPDRAARTAIVVTSISAPNDVLRSLAAQAAEHDAELIVVGDAKSPADFELAGCRFLGLDHQRSLNLDFAVACPTGHYARKNVGYLDAIARGARRIVETDDDNQPRPDFLADRPRAVASRHVVGGGWINVYRYFTDEQIWPRGFPLDALQEALPDFDDLRQATIDCPIQQGLADGNPDVDAIYRLLNPAEIRFRDDRRVALGRGTWCPFNSQNTTWWPDAFALLYLPSHCSFRMTDIWRGFVAQRIAWENGWHVLFHPATVWQDRNSHDLMRDFEDEVPGYLANRRLCGHLANLALRAGVAHIPDNVRACYAELTSRGFVGREELSLLDTWLADLERVTA
jgi:hypothetical protein